MEEVKITPGSGNVFADLGLPEPELMLAKAKLVIALDRIIRRKGLQEREAAELVKLAPNRLRALLCGDFRDLTIGQLAEVVKRIRQPLPRRLGAYKRRVLYPGWFRKP